jgi:hypothetical protein
MKRLILLVGLLAPSLTPTISYGHGNPVTVNLVNGQLTVSNGLGLSSGFVTLAFDDHEDAFLDVAPGNTLGTTLPGFEVNDVAAGSQLRLEVIPRPDFTDPSTPLRWLWFWDKETQHTDEAPDDPLLRLASQRGFGDVRITQFVAPATGPSFQILEPKASEIGTHQHPILYLLDDSPAAKFGAYGFFARLTSPNYVPSEPFLIALNHNLSTEEYGLAAREINAAASLPGDFNGNDAVDGADFLAWQRSFGSTTELAADGSLNGTVDADDLAVWKANFGRTWPASGIGVAAVVPEPSTLSIATLMFAAFAARRQRAVRTGCRE